MNICIFYYDDFYGAEVILALGVLSGENIFAAALEDRVYVSHEKQRYLPDKTIDQLKPEEIDLFLIPGGDTNHLFESEKLRSFINALNKKGKYIAGVCGGTFLMASSGILSGRRCTGGGTGIRPECYPLFEGAVITNEDVVVDGNAVTSKAISYVEFAVELGKVMKVYKSEEEAEKDYKWLKNTKE